MRSSCAAVRRSLGWLIVTAALSAAAMPAGAQAPVAAPQPAPISRDWKRLRTANLIVLGNAAVSDMRRVAVEIERFRLALTTIAPAMKLDSTTPTLVVVFRDDRALTPFKPRARGKPIDNVAAYFSPHADVNYIVMAPSGVREFTIR